MTKQIMELTHKIENNICIISIIGNIQQDGVNSVKTYLNFLLEDTSTKAIIMNLQAVSSINSAGLGMILRVSETLEKRQSKLLLSNLNSRSKEIFQITHLDNILGIFSTVEEALASLE